MGVNFRGKLVVKRIGNVIKQGFKIEKWVVKWILLPCNSSSYSPKHPNIWTCNWIISSNLSIPIQHTQHILIWYPSSVNCVPKLGLKLRVTSDILASEFWRFTPQWPVSAWLVRFFLDARKGLVHISFYWKYNNHRVLRWGWLIAIILSLGLCDI